MAQRHAARGDHGPAVDRGDGHRGVVDDPVDDHRGHVLLHRDLVGGDAGDLPGELVLALQEGFGRRDLHRVQLHRVPRSCWSFGFLLELWRGCFLRRTRAFVQSD